MKTRVVVLAAGHGKRMNHHLPKVLRPLKGRPTIQHLLDAVVESGVDSRPIVVVGLNNREIIRDALGDGYEYVLQKHQHGTGHAVQVAKETLEGKADTVIVLYGDHPFVKSSTISKLQELHKKGGCPLTMATTVVENFNDWRAPLYDFGRVVRNGRGEIHENVEKKDATPEQLKIKEVNPSYFCFETDWLWDNIQKLESNNSQSEYYLTDLVRIAIDSGHCITSINISPLESIGVNTPEHLELASKLVS